tara:strand:+ start:36048 stop:37679 length:1632 start_codon:yes stop_codon:yes gene_type:complete
LTESSDFVAEIAEALRSTGAVNITYSTQKKNCVWCFDFVCGNHNWSLKVVAKNANLNNLPTIYWMTNTPVWGWPHVGFDGDVCVSDREGLEYDPEDYRGVIGWLVNEAVQLLGKYSTYSEQERLTEFADEIEGYYSQMGAIPVALDERVDTTKRLYCESTYYPLPRTWKSHPVVYRLNHGSTRYKACQQQRLAILDVTIDQLPKYPCVKAEMQWDLNWWTTLISQLDLKQRKIALDDKTRGLLLRVKNAFGQGLLLLHWGTKDRCSGWMYIVGRQYRDYVMSRSGGESITKHAVVIGCGAIGSRVAEQLALAGIDKLTLVDFDKFSADNLARHILGSKAIGQYKVNALAELLTDNIPGILIDSKKTDIDQVSDETLRKADAIVLATGKPALERAIVQRAFNSQWKALTVSVSVEACGLGGHSIASLPGMQGCLECLYINPDSGETELRFRGSFVADGEKVTRQLTGCGAFTPYSALDATKTAVLAVEQVLQGTTGYARWVGEASKALAAGITPSEAHTVASHSSTNPIKPNAYAHGRCKCCGI